MVNLSITMILLLLALIVTASCHNQISPSPSFDHFQVYRITPRSQEEVKILRKLEDNPRGYDFWTGVSTIGQTVDIMVPTYLKYNFQDLLSLQKFDAELWIENVQQLIDNEQSQKSKRPEQFDWKDYYTLESIYAWLDSLAEEYPDIVTPIIGGQSYEGREIRGVKLSFGPGKKGVFIEGGIHAREWISPATVTYLLNELITNGNTTVRSVAASRDWYIFPSVNPDGYVYTLKDRMWRKNRQPYGICYGVDPNRNWSYHWMDGGASSNECSQTFAGSAPFSEPEIKSLSEYITNIADNLDTVLTFHSYGQLFLIPFGHKGNEVPENNEELHRIGRAAAESLKVRYGTVYEVGNIPQVLSDYTSGSTVDWTLGTFRHLRTVFAYELRDKGRYGFILPPEQIIPSGEETLDSLVRIFLEIDASKS